jgi:mannitol/fructose-specific phosphotransferase system IIA component (Ntr-type)
MRWLVPNRIILQLAVASPAELVRRVAETMDNGSRLPHIQAAFMEAFEGEGFSLGAGVAIPHIELEGQSETAVCLVTTAAPLSLCTIDGRDPDVFLFILSKPDPKSHLLLLAQLARLARSKTLRKGLRKARSPNEVVELVHAAEQRHAPSRPQAVTRQPGHAVVFVSVSGEKLVDDLLVALVDDGFGDGCIVEAQTVREAVAREVPLFAGFRDIFGDPGGRRLLVVEVAAARVTAIVEVVRRLCEEHGAKDGQVSVIPIETRWSSALAAPDTHQGH